MAPSPEPPETGGLGIPGADPGGIGIPAGDTKTHDGEPPKPPPKGEGKTDGVTDGPAPVA